MGKLSVVSCRWGKRVASSQLPLPVRQTSRACPAANLDWERSWKLAVRVCRATLLDKTVKGGEAEGGRRRIRDWRSTEKWRAEKCRPDAPRRGTRGRRAKQLLPSLDVTAYLYIFTIPGNSPRPVPRIGSRSGRLFDNLIRSPQFRGTSKRER
jgi:hypothetical protein